MIVGVVAGTSLPERRGGAGRPVGFGAFRRGQVGRPEGRSERGETLIETLVTIVLMGLTVVALLAGFVTVARLVDRNSRMTHAGNTAQSYAEQLKQPVDDVIAAMEYQPCTAGPVEYPGFEGELPGSAYAAEVVPGSLRFAQDVSGGGSGTVSWSESCPTEDRGLQLMVVEVTVDSGDAPIVESVPVVKRDARCEYSAEYENTDMGPC